MRARRILRQAVNDVDAGGARHHCVLHIGRLDVPDLDRVVEAGRELRRVSTSLLPIAAYRAEAAEGEHGGIDPVAVPGQLALQCCEWVRAIRSATKLRPVRMSQNISDLSALPLMRISSEDRKSTAVTGPVCALSTNLLVPAVPG